MQTKTNNTRKILAMLIAGLSLLGCSKDDPESYTLTVTHGAGSGSYPGGTSVSISARPAPNGATFHKWTGSTAIADRNAAATSLTMPEANTSIAASFVCDCNATTSTLDLSSLQDTISTIWYPGINHVENGRGINYSTVPGVGNSQQLDGMMVTTFSIANVNSDYITTGNSKDVLVEGPINSIIELWDLETLEVIGRNDVIPGIPILFTALPNHRYGGFAWYANNAQKTLGISADFD